MPESKGNAGGESLSLQTLVIAAGASAAAAVVVSHLWKDGTVIAAAMTPVIVAIVKELLARPMESEIVRKPVKQVSRIASSRLSVPSRTPTGGDVDPPSPTEPGDLRRDYGHGDGVPPTEPQLTPMRTYGRTRRRPIHLKVAIVTGLVAFLIAAAVLTLPELLFGGAISSRHDTTLFGGGGSSKSDKQKSNDKGTTTQQNQPKPSNQTTTPAPTTGSKPPARTTPAPTSPRTTPQQTSPQQTTPLPTTPTTPAP
ncbi:MAG: hypothetical protein QOH76_2473 [Thermoleophilaceae bacterium]|nr:hypothetical protein [Thermoleophilaceae bacterium]